MVMTINCRMIIIVHTLYRTRLYALNHGLLSSTQLVHLRWLLRVHFFEKKFISQVPQRCFSTYRNLILSTFQKYWERLERLIVIGSYWEAQNLITGWFLLRSSEPHHGLVLIKKLRTSSRVGSYWEAQNLIMGWFLLRSSESPHGLVLVYIPSLYIIKRE